jgi:hypothetical protein
VFQKKLPRTQTVPVGHPMISVASLSPQRPSLAALISFSIQPMSGIPASESAFGGLIGMVRSASTCRFSLRGSTNLRRAIVRGLGVKN